MTEEQEAVFAALMAEALAFWRQPVSEFALRVWWEAAKRFDLDQVTAAISAHCLDPERGRFPMMPADLVKALDGTPTDRALVAWGKAYGAISHVGAYRSVAFDDPAIHCAIEDMGGWVKFCGSPTADLPHIQRRFCELYRTYAARGADGYTAKLVGLTEQENYAHGLEPPVVQPVMLIGDIARARAVLQGGQSGGRLRVTALGAAAANGLRLSLGENPNGGSAARG